MYFIWGSPPFSLVASSTVPNLNLYSADAATYFPLRRIGEGGRVDNITDWALEQFRAHYEKDKEPKRPITKDAVFDYVYGMLHDPIYREKYALESQARVSAHSVLSRLLEMGRMGRETDGAAHWL